MSRTTVSFVLNERTDVKIPDQTRARVLAAAQRLGYHPIAAARQLVGGRSHVLALVLRQTPEQVASDAILAETLRGLAVAARTQSFRVVVEPLAHDGTAHDTYEDLVRGRLADGLVISGPRIDDPQLQGLIRDGFPVVIQGALPDLEVDSVDVDNVEGARGAVGHLVSIGHRRIACITNAPLVYTAAQQRYEGYLSALHEAGIQSDPDLLEPGDFDAASGHRAMSRLLERTDFSAVFVASDVVALGAIGALRDAGRSIPGDVSVVGFDDIPLAAYFDPPLTTVRLPAFELGQAAGRALLERIAGQTTTRRTLLPTELIVRASTARLGGAGHERRPADRGRSAEEAGA